MKGWLLQPFWQNENHSGSEAPETENPPLNKGFRNFYIPQNIHKKSFISDKSLKNLIN